MRTSLRGTGCFKRQLLIRLIQRFHRHSFTYKEASRLMGFNRSQFMDLYCDGMITRTSNCIPFRYSIMNSLVEDSANQPTSPLEDEEDRVVEDDRKQHPLSHIEKKSHITKRVRKQQHTPLQTDSAERMVDTVMQKDGTRKTIISEEIYEHLPSDFHRLVVDVLVSRGEWVIIKRHSSSAEDGNSKV